MPSGERKRTAIIQTLRHGSEFIPRAFTDGCGGELMPPHDFLANYKEFDEVAFYGVLRGGTEVYRLCEREGIRFYYMDHSYFHPAHGFIGNASDFWFRISVNDHQACNFVERPGDRFGRFFAGRKLDPWKQRRRKILICPPSVYMADFFNAHRWLDDVLARIEFQVKTLRMEIEVRETRPNKDYRQPIEHALKDAYMAIVYNSQVAIDALWAGVPIYQETGAEAWMNSNLDDIAHPNFKDRKQLFYHLAYSQFSIPEIRNGIAYRMLNGEDGAWK